MRFDGKVTHIIDKCGRMPDKPVFILYQYRIQEDKSKSPQALLLTVRGDSLPVLSVGDVVRVDYTVKCIELNGKLCGSNIATDIIKLF